MFLIFNYYDNYLQTTFTNLHLHIIELAEYLNIKQTTYSKYELGKINIPIEVFIKLADYYDVSIDYLVGRSIKKK